MMSMLSFEEKLGAMRACDSRFDGRFWVGVHSTGIYCLVSCPAKTPLAKNIVFYDTREEAETAGLRACKRCRPERFPRTDPEWMEAVLAFMRSRVPEHVHEAQLSRIAGQSIATVRRHFREQFGVGPMAYHRRLRLEYARRRLSEGADLLATALECGFESASGFHDAFSREFGRTPGGRHEL